MRYGGCWGRSRLADERLKRAVPASLRTVLVTMKSTSLVAGEVHYGAGEYDAQSARDRQPCQQGIQPIPVDLYLLQEVLAVAVSPRMKVGVLETAAALVIVRAKTTLAAVVTSGT